MNGLLRKLRSYKLLLISLGVLFVYSTTLVFAAGGPYTPGTQLDPSCLPTDNTCYVTTPVGGVTIGDTVNGGTPTQILYTDGAGNVASDAGFTRNSTTGETGIFAPSLDTNIQGGLLIQNGNGQIGGVNSIILNSNLNEVAIQGVTYDRTGGTGELTAQLTWFDQGGNGDQGSIFTERGQAVLGYQDTSGTANYTATPGHSGGKYQSANTISYFDLTNSRALF
jgi:hypothetical protein